MTIADEIRAETKRILKRNFGLPNELAAIKISTVARIDAYVTDAEDRAAACTCREPEAFSRMAVWSARIAGLAYGRTDRAASAPLR
jgi:tetrahydromethanopterin S-methyltransferase subunit F